MADLTLEVAESHALAPHQTGASRKPRTAGAKEGPLHRAADRHVPQIAVAVRLAFAMGRRALRKQPRNIDGAVAAIEDSLASTLPAVLKKVYTAGGAIAAKRLSGLRVAKKADAPAKVRISFTFDAKREAAISWADRHAAEAISNISETSREDINNAVAEYLETGDFEAQYDAILEAVGSETRADLIARNESMIAVHSGQREAWDQAVDEGLLTGNEVRGWIVVGDEKVCPICQGLEGQQAKLGGTYSSDGEEYDGPPAHVSCRCSEGIV